MGNLFLFFREAWTELKKVVWPSRRLTIRLTLGVLAVTFVIAGIVAGLDYLFNKFLSFLVER